MPLPRVPLILPWICCPVIPPSCSSTHQGSFGYTSLSPHSVGNWVSAIIKLISLFLIGAWRGSGLHLFHHPVPSVCFLPPQRHWECTQTASEFFFPFQILFFPLWRWKTSRKSETATLRSVGTLVSFCFSHFVSKAHMCTSS